MTVSEVLPVILYILGAILLVALIVLTVRLIITMNKIDKIVDNITVKVRALDGVFAVVETASSKFNLLTTQLVDTLASLISKIFSHKRKDDENE